MSLLENKKLKKAAGLLNSEAPDDHFLAYITADERDMLVDAGGVKTPTKSGVFAYPGHHGSSGSSMGVEQGSSNNNNQGSDRGHSRFDSGYYGGTPTSTTTTTNNNNDNQSTARERYITDYSSKGIVKGGGALIGYDKDDTPIYENTKVDPEVVERQKIEYAEQFGGVPPLGSRPVTYATKYEYNQMKYIADSKLDTIKGKLKIAGFTDFDEDATLSEMKEYVKNLNRTGKIGDSWKNAKDRNGNPLYSPETIAKWEKSGYVPQSQSTRLPSFDLAMKVFSPTGTGGAPLSYDQLVNDFDTIAEVGQTQGMNWQDRMKTYSPKQWESYSGQVYDPINRTYSDPVGGGGEADRVARVEGSYNIGGTEPQESVAAKWYSGMNNKSSEFFFKNEYDNAKNKIKAVLGTPSAIGQVAVGNSIFFDFLKKNSLDKGIL
jgi:hypothetical protein